MFGYIKVNTKEKEQNLLTFLQENGVSYEYLCEICPPKFIEIIKHEPNISLNELFSISSKYIDFNMLEPFDEDIQSFSHDTFEGDEPNIENLKQYNLHNVVAFNANIDKLRETWKDMPNMDDFDKNQTWPEHSRLYYSIEFGKDQIIIESMFLQVFGKDCIMPKHVIGNEELIEKYSSRYTPHRKFTKIDGRRKVIQED